MKKQKRRLLRKLKRTAKQELTASQLEYLADLLRERIYATIALLAVLISIDTNHSSPGKAAAVVGGTAVSLWVASLVATKMSRRMVLGRADPPAETERQLRRHTPLLAAGIFPLMAISLAGVGIVSLSAAINGAIGASLLLMVGWSIASARAISPTKGSVIVLGAIELAVGLAVVWFKLLVGH